VWDGLKSASRSLPAVTFNHSTTTTPLKASGSAGLRTRIRVMKFALVEGWACHRPSGSHVPTLEYAVALPPIRCSAST
jgi:hypothetical protein